MNRFKPKDNSSKTLPSTNHTEITIMESSNNNSLNGNGRSTAVVELPKAEELATLTKV